MTEDEILKDKTFFERHKLGRVDWESYYRASIVRMTEEGLFKCSCDCSNKKPAPKAKPKAKKVVDNEG